MDAVVAGTSSPSPVKGRSSSMCALRRERRDGDGRGSRHRCNSDLPPPPSKEAVAGNHHCHKTLVVVHHHCRRVLLLLASVFSWFAASILWVLGG
ncbi:hypothetical protein PIB30_012961 [Stylosanthes scabra]|uniref:Uncharacterized protein n=1 Tax=Stylosanthes scabra TaxID=79078 RepID=A0ABU6Z2W9_9FABA|nr:hypothetical protein [Stylosanthes scabra]